MKRFLVALTLIFVIGSSYRDQKITVHLNSLNHVADSAALVHYLQTLIAREKFPLMKRHFESLLLMTQDTINGYAFTEKNHLDAGKVLQFLKDEGHLWQTYLFKPRPLIMAFTSPTDHKNSYYWLFLPKNYGDKKYPLFVELHGSGGGANNNPREMLYQPLQPEIAGVTVQGYRKGGIFYSSMGAWR